MLSGTTSIGAECHFEIGQSLGGDCRKKSIEVGNQDLYFHQVGMLDVLQSSVRYLQNTIYHNTIFTSFDPWL